MKNRPFAGRLRVAFAGIAIVWRRERSFRTQIKLALGAAMALAWLRPGPWWIALVIGYAALVLALEMINSALEYLIDHLHPAQAPEIGRAKDAAAGAVLLASIAALAIGLLMVYDTLR